MRQESLKVFLLERIKDTLIEIFNEMSSTMHLYPINEEKDFRRGEWTPLNVNHDNVILRYIALAACKSDDIWGYFYSHFQLEVMEGLKEDFECFYQCDSVNAHNLAIFVGHKLAKLEAFFDVIGEVDASLITDLYPWFFNPVTIAENDWR